MRKSAEAQFRERYPNATVERRRVDHGPTYYLIRRVPRDFMPCGEGKTAAAAWKDALLKQLAVEAREKLKA